MKLITKRQADHSKTDHHRKSFKLASVDVTQRTASSTQDKVFDPTTPTLNPPHVNLEPRDGQEILETPKSISSIHDTPSIINKKRPSGEPLLFTHYDHIRSPLVLSDLQQLVLWCLHENSINPKHFLVKNRNSIERVVLLHVPGLHPNMLLPSPSNPNEFKQAVRLTEFGSPMTNFLHEPNSTKPIFSHLLPLIGPGRQTNIDCITWSFLKKLSKDFRNHLFSDKKSHQQERKQFRKKKETVAVHRPKNSQIHIPSSLLLSKSTMQENSIPLHPVLTEEAESTYPEGWVHSRITSLCMENKHWRLLSIDCEMCGTKNGSELTRVSVMAHDGKVLLNEFVKPHNPILDYRTLYSGITSDHLENVTTRLADIQKQLFEIVDENSVLVGHSVENDLFALQFTHPYILDTSILYSPAPNVKLRLRSLSKKYLQREIQCSDGTNEGHCSLEDAEATLDLTLLKLKEDKEMTSDEKLPPFNPSLIHFLKTSLVPKTTTYINCKNLGEKVLMDEAQTLTYASIEDFLPTLQEALALDSQLIYAELPFLSAISLQSINEEEQKSIATTLQLISQVYEQLPTRTLFLVFSASTDLPLLEKAKLEFQHRRTNANNTEFIKFCKAVRKSKTGCALLRLKSFS